MSISDIWPWSFSIHGNPPWKQHTGSLRPQSSLEKYNNFLKTKKE